MKILFLSSPPNTRRIEIVERKGLGHPDTLADGLAEELSCEYAKLTLSKFGYILHHDFDKIALVGGKSRVEFGKGYIVSPIKVYLNCRISTQFANQSIDVKKFLSDTTISFLKKKLPDISRNDIRIHYGYETSSSPGGVKGSSGPREYWFTPRGPEDLPELKILKANDTAIGCSFFPLSTAEKIALEVENFLNSKQYKKNNPWCGYDIKIHVIKVKQKVEITLAIPQIAKHVFSLKEYISNLEKVKRDIQLYINEHFPGIKKLNIFTNTRDIYEIPELYLTAIGSSLETGDIGVVGRGNRINGLITPFKCISIEAPYGKNPVYHAGKIYNVLARILSKEIYFLTGHYNEVYLISQSGRKLSDPWKVIVKGSGLSAEKGKIKEIIKDYLNSIPEITKEIINKKLKLVV